MSAPEPPTAKLVIEYPANIDPRSDAANDYALERILAFADELRARGERPAFEVWYPGTTAADFDAVEVADDGTIATLPPYSQSASEATA